MSNAFVSIIMGSDSDLPLLENTMAILKGFGIRYEARVASAHRTPDVVSSYVADAEKRGCAVFIGAAGLAAHLAGAIAARTTRPVIGIPCDGGPLSGIDALYSNRYAKEMLCYTVQLLVILLVLSMNSRTSKQRNSLSFL